MKDFTKHLLLLCLFGMISMGAKASYTRNEYDFKVNGIYYQIYSSSQKTVSVTCQQSVHFGESYSGIPNGYAYHDVGGEDDYDYTYYISDYSGNVTIPSTVYYNGTTYNVTRIKKYAFSNCFNVTSVTVPSSVTYIAPYAFENCSGKLILNCNVNEENEYDSWSEYYENVVPYILYNSKFAEIIIGEGVDNINYLFGSYYKLADLKSITIPSTLLKIAGVFSKDRFCSLTQVNISNLANWFKIVFAENDDNPLCVGAGLYYNGTLLTSITVPSSITKINDYALYGCKSISSITIPNTIESIGKYAFAGCSAIQSMDLPTSVIELQDYAFQNCTSLTTINMPSSLTVFGKGVFDGCEKLQSPIYTASTFIKMPVSYSGSYTIQSGISSIAVEAFKDCSKLVGVTIPNSVITINNSAFQGCSNLTSLSIQSGVQTIGTSAFSGCSSLTSLTIPSSVTAIGASAFNGCSGKATINCKLPSSISSSSNSPFNNSKFTEIALNGNDTSIPDYAFYGCSSMTKFTIPSTVTSIGKSAFYGCSSLTSFTIPSAVNSIGSYAFNGCSSLTSLTIPSTVTSIGGSAFSGCSGKATINCKLPSSISSSSNSPFYNSKFTEIVLNGNDISIPNYAFYGCSSLTSFTIPSMVTSIGTSAFSGCSSLTSFTIPSMVTSIGTSAFSGCSSLTSLTIPSTVTSIGGSAFYGCSKLTSLTIPSAVNSISASTFYGCSSLTSLTIPSTVNSIGSNAFNGCSSLTSLTIPSTVTSIGGSAFSGCSGKATINCKLPSSISSSSNSPFYNSKFTEIVLNGNDISIPDYAFYGCSSLTSFTIPSTVTSIGKNAFYGCSSLTSLTIPSIVTSIGASAFYGCSGKATINCKLPSSISSSSNSPFYYSKFTEIALNGNDTSIPDYAFYGCSSMTKFTIPSTVNSIGSNAFNGCSSLTSLTIPSTVTSIGYSAFNGCSGKATINCKLPSSISSDSDSPFYYSKFTEIALNGNDTSIPDYAFYECSSLAQFTIPSTVTRIGKSAFYRCSDISSIDIPSSINRIGDNAFNGMMCLEKITVHNPTPVTITSSVFDGINLNRCTLFVPVGSRKNYIKAVGWTDITNIVEYASGSVLCSSVSLNKPTASLTLGGTETLTATVLPEDATDKSVTWSSDNESVATVVDGVVTAVAVGTANITAKTNDGSNLSATCVVTVTSKSSGDEPSEDIEPSTDITEYTNVLYINDIKAWQGTEFSLPLNMKNAEEDITAFECKVYLPEGVEWASTIDNRGNKIFVQPTFNEERTDANYHTINSIKQMEDGSYYVIVYSDKKEIILDKDGAILYMPLTVSEEIEPGDYNIFVKDIVMVNENTEQVLIDKTVSKLTVPSYTIGDANDDGMINITDVVAVISYMLKESPNPFIFKAADVNCDEMINVTDVVGIIDIMTSGANNAKPEMAMAKKAVKKSAKSGNSLEIVPFTVAAGTTSMNVALELNNPGDEFTALECKVFLPEGVDWDYTIDRRGNKIYKQPTFNEDRTDANYHTINSISKVDGGYYVIVYSDKKEIFLDEDGALLYLPLVFDENINPGVYDIRVGDIVLARPDVTQELLDDYTASVLVGSPEIASLSLNGDFTVKAIGEYNTALASNTKVAAMDFSNATDIDASTAIATGNKNLLVYVAEGKSIANEDNAVIGDQCANLVLTDGHSFCAPKSFTATKASYERAASSNYGTLCLPFAPKSAASELYELTSSTESQLMFSAVASPAANTPYLYKSDTGKIAESNVEVVAEDAGNTMNGIWTMTGTYTMQTFSASDNVFALYEGKLYKNVGTLTMNPFRAYFATESSASKAEVFIETPTGIESITGSQSIGNGNMFNVQGLRVNENYKGVKIINGKKYVK